MGTMIDGRWTTDEELASLRYREGRFERSPSVIRHWITPDGSPGPTGDGGFKAEAGRYHLYVAFGCPWAHRTLIFRVLKGLEDRISVSFAAPRRTEQGWVFDNATPDYADTCLGKSALWEVYADGHPGYTGRVTVPTLYDRKSARIVSNESADIIRMLNSAFDDAGARPGDYYPEPLRPEIDALNERIYEGLNNGVYRAGFALTQEAYEEAFDQVFETLDFLDRRLADRRYLCGSEQTEADWRLFPTLVRFDVAYHYAFKCNLRRLSDYEHLWPYARDLYQTENVRDTVFFDLYKQGYFSLSELRNPLGIVPKGPLIDFDQPHDRERLG
ncbi:MAG: glutathione S-transferase family protein [Gammaproteobacteria bacterium]|nr:glutathione S-transferase family protein [Gammaproteobacteria bacterium]